MSLAYSAFGAMAGWTTVFSEEAFALKVYVAPDFQTCPPSERRVSLIVDSKKAGITRADHNFVCRGSRWSNLTPSVIEVASVGGPARRELYTYCVSLLECASTQEAFPERLMKKAALVQQYAALVVLNAHLRPTDFFNETLEALEPLIRQEADKIQQAFKTYAETMFFEAGYNKCVSSLVFWKMPPPIASRKSTWGAPTGHSQKKDELCGAGKRAAVPLALNDPALQLIDGTSIEDQMQFREELDKYLNPEAAASSSDGSEAVKAQECTQALSRKNSVISSDTGYESASGVLSPGECSAHSDSHENVQILGRKAGKQERETPARSRKSTLSKVVTRITVARQKMRTRLGRSRPMKRRSETPVVRRTR